MDTDFMPLPDFIAAQQEQMTVIDDWIATLRKKRKQCKIPGEWTKIERNIELLLEQKQSIAQGIKELTKGGGIFMTQSQRDFIAKVGALARADAAKSGVLPSLTIAQAICESGWGKSGLTVRGNALFGIKATANWRGARLNCKTFEYYSGARADTTDCFRAYKSWEESVTDHGAFLRGLSRYNAVIGERDYKKACHAIKAAGYATAPNYAQALIKLIEDYKLTDYDGATVTATATQSGATTCYTIKSSADTLWSLAARYLGDGNRWPEIAAANGGLDPKKVRVGQTIKIPKK